MECDDSNTWFNWNVFINGILLCSANPQTWFVSTLNHYKYKWFIGFAVNKTFAYPLEANAVYILLQSLFIRLVRHSHTRTYSFMPPFPQMRPFSLNIFIGCLGCSIAPAIWERSAFSKKIYRNTDKINRKNLLRVHTKHINSCIQYPELWNALTRMLFDRLVVSWSTHFLILALFFSLHLLFVFRIGFYSRLVFVHRFASSSSLLVIVRRVFPPKIVISPPLSHLCLPLHI